MNKALLLILFFLIFDFTHSQSNSTLEMAKTMSHKKVEISELNDFVRQNISDKTEVAKFFYYWISLNIDYDHKTASKSATALTKNDVDESNNPYIVFKSKKAICAGYSNLFKLFMGNFNIDCHVVSGYVKTLENLTLEMDLDDDFRHAWNVIRIDNDWLLVDTTWAQQFEEDISDYYFNTEPQRLILSHFPEEEKWQLVSKPISIEEFNRQPYVHSFYFETGFGELPKLTEDTIYYYIEFPKNPSNNWLTKLTYDSKNKINESIFPEYLEEEKSNVFRFKKNKLPENSILNVVVAYFDWEKQTKAEYKDIIKYQL